MSRRIDAARDRYEWRFQYDHDRFVLDDQPMQVDEMWIS
jgi:hypothetical protein